MSKVVSSDRSFTDFSGKVEKSFYSKHWWAVWFWSLVIVTFLFNKLNAHEIHAHLPLTPNAETFFTFMMLFWLGFVSYSVCKFLGSCVGEGVKSKKVQVKPDMCEGVDLNKFPILQRTVHQIRAERIEAERIEQFQENSLEDKMYDKAMQFYLSNGKPLWNDWFGDEHRATIDRINREVQEFVFHKRGY